MIGLLRATSGPLKGAEFALGTRTLLGRSGDSDIQLMEQAVSRRHALILLQGDGHYWLGDLDSTNGTFLGEERVESHRLQPGDVIHLGKSTLIYQELPQAGRGGAPAAGVVFQLLSGPAENATRGLPLPWLQKIWAEQRRRARDGAPDTLPVQLPEQAETTTVSLPPPSFLERRAL